ncbi:MAG: LapA family protein [Desulfuromonadales bacterium]|nr:LapA family protein [Desulfuromonadales bacterium]
MSVRIVLLLLVFTLLAVFTAVNWPAFTAPTTLSLLVTMVEAPLGLIMLLITLLLTVLFIAYAVYLQTTVLLESRQHTRELKAQRELADQAEASRFTALRNFLEAELTQLGADSRQTRTEVLARLEETERGLRTSVEQTGNSLAAYLGEIEERMAQGPPSSPTTAG